MSKPLKFLFFSLILSTLFPAQADPKHALDAIVFDLIDEDVPGVILVVDGPDLKYRRAEGVANRKTGSPMSLDHCLRVASVTKTYIASLAVGMALDGALDLDQQIDTLLPESVLAKTPMASMPTVRHLLNHTSGIPDYYTANFYRNWKKSDPLSTPRILEAVSKRKPTNLAGEAFAYSNTNYHLIALILEGLSDTTIEHLLTESLFGPVGLEATFYNKHRPECDGVHGYGSVLRKWKDTYEWRENTGPDGGIKATANDLVKWLRSLLSEDGQLTHIGNIMSQNSVDETDRKSHGLGLELLYSRTGTVFIGHGGDNFGYLTALYYSPEFDTVVLLHINRWDQDSFSGALGRVFTEVMRQSKFR